MASNTTNTEKLKLYLIGDEDKKGFLLEEANNGKTIMLSGAWGAGKTHFWKEEIEINNNLKSKECDRSLFEFKNRPCDYEKSKLAYLEHLKYEKGLHSKLKQKNKAYVYVSLYGKTSIESIELDVYMKAYENIVGNADYVSKTLSVFTNIGKNLGNMVHKGAGGGFSWIENLVDKDKFYKAGEYLTDGGIICFDDFERKSKDIDLNDLFGFISQLAIEYKSKIVIILNSDVFEGKEAEIFKRVKEKTVNKYFYFKPSIGELFNSIYDEKYSQLDKYKYDILKAIKETEELNARLYIQVLDKCLEWENKRNLDKYIIRVLVLGTINFVLNHITLDYQEISEHTKEYNKKSKFENRASYFMNIPYQIISLYFIELKDYIRIEYDSHKEAFIDEVSNFRYYKTQCKKISDLEFIHNLKKYIPDEKNFIEEKEVELQALWKYGYRLYYVADVEKEVYEEIAEFIESGILL